MKEIIESNFDNMAEEYENYKDEYYDLDIFLKNSPSRKQNALDIGCGIGRLTAK